MRIDAVVTQPDRAGRYTVKLEDGSVMRLYRQTIEDFGIYSGKLLEEEELTRLRIAAGQMSAKMRAVRIVSASSVSKSDLERRLIQKGENREDAKRAVAWMADLDLLDDEKTARQVVQSCVAKGYGRARAKQALYEKRIAKEYWDAALSDYPDQEDKILAFLQSRLKENRDEKTVRRAIDGLIRRGHSYHNIRRVLDTHFVLGEFQEDIDV